MGFDRLSQMRVIARIIARQSQTNRAFRERLFLDPVEILTEAGIPESAIPDFLREVTTDVSGYLCQFTCLQTYIDS